MADSTEGRGGGRSPPPPGSAGQKKCFFFLVKFMRVKGAAPPFSYALDLSLVTRRHYPTLAKALYMMHIIYVLMSVTHERKKNHPAFPFDNIKNIDHWRIWGGGGGIAIPVVSEVKIKLRYCYTVTHSCAMVSYNQWRPDWRGGAPPPPQYC